MEKMNAHEVLLTVMRIELIRQGGESLHESEIAVACWQRDPMVFGLNLFRSQHPDNKRVSAELVSAHRTGPRARGWIRRVAPSRWALTPLGNAVAARLLDPAAFLTAYSLVASRATSLALDRWLEDRDWPNSLRDLTVKAFLDSQSPQEVELAARRALHLLNRHDVEYLTRPRAGDPHRLRGREFPAIHHRRIAALLDFCQSLTIRFGQLV